MRPGFMKVSTFQPEPPGVPENMLPPGSRVKRISIASNFSSSGGSSPRISVSLGDRSSTRACQRSSARIWASSHPWTHSPKDQRAMFRYGDAAALISNLKRYLDAKRRSITGSSCSERSATRPRYRRAIIVRCHRLTAISRMREARFRQHRRSLLPDWYRIRCRYIHHEQTQVGRNRYWVPSDQT